MSGKRYLAERRYKIATVLSVLALIVAYNDFIPYYLAIFVIFFSSSVTLYLNSRNESYLGENDGRLILLAIMLGIMSYAYLMTHMNNHIKINDAMRYCYSEQEVNSNFCEEMYDILNTKSVDTYDAIRDEYF